MRRVCSTERYSLGSAVVRHQVSTTCVPWVFTRRTASPGASLTASEAPPEISFIRAPSSASARVRAAQPAAGPVPIERQAEHQHAGPLERLARRRHEGIDEQQNGRQQEYRGNYRISRRAKRSRAIRQRSAKNEERPRGETIEQPGSENNL